MSRVVTVLKRIGKWIAIVLAVLLLVLILVLAALFMALRSDTGTAWVLEKVPGLETTDAQGSFLGVWQAEALRWQGYGINLAIDNPYLDWSPTCLARKTLCLDELRADAINLQRQPVGAAEDDKGPVTLPDLGLPLDLDIDSVDLGRFEFNGTLVWDQLNLEAESGGTDWHLQGFQVQRDAVALTANGRVETRGDWPVSLELAATLPPPYGESWRVSGRASGSIRNLRLSLESSGYLDASLIGELAPLDPAFPARLELQSDRFLALDTLPPTLALTDWAVTARGNLENGYRIRTTATLPGDPVEIDLDLSGRITTTGADDLALQLTGPSAIDDGQAQLLVEGSASWEQGMVAQADVTMDAFPWYALLPQVEPLPVMIRQLAADGEYQNGEYRATLDVDASGSMGDSTLATVVEGDLEQVRLTDLTMTTGAGRLTGDATVGFADPVSWRADLALTGFDPGFWMPQASASINGSVFSEGHLNADGQPEFTARWDLEGNWRSAELNSRGLIEAGEGLWQIPEVITRIGSNELTASGELHNPLGSEGEMDVMASLMMPEPEIVLPDLFGHMEASLALSGSFRDPQGSLEVQATEAGWGDQLTIDRLGLDASLQPGRELDASLSVAALGFADQVLDQVTADLSGTLDSHRLDLSVEHPDVLLDTAVTGGWNPDAGAWAGELAAGEIRLTGPQQEWALEEGAAIAYTVGDSLTFGAHCWRWQDSSVCAGDQTLLPDPALDYELSRFPAASLAPLLPETLRWEALINARVDVALSDQGPRGQVTVNAGPGEVSVVMEEDWKTLTYQTLDLTLDLAPAQAGFSLLLSGQGLGDLSVDLTVDPTGEQRVIQGEFSLSGFDLALVGGLLNMEEVGGFINGSGRVEGPLMNPQVFGELVLDNGRVIDPMVPLPVQDLTVQLALEGRRATVEGSWRSGDTGQGSVDGTLDWRGSPKLTMALRGEALPVTYEPYAYLEVSPDLELRFNEGDLSITGEINVPRGQVEVRELPEQAVAVSDDEVVVGQEPEEAAVRSFDMDIQVSVGSDEVSFEGFGVTGDLEGGLRIGNEMDTRGALQLVDGRYEAFGQELELRRARLVFVGPVTEPYLDIEAIRRVDNIIAGIRLSGPASEPTTEVFSEPPMPQDQALSYVILGRPLQSQGDQGQMSRAALSLGLTQASKITRGIGEGFGIRDLTLEAEGSGEESSVVASGYLTDELSIRYGVGLFEPLTTVALRYELGRYFYIEAASGLAASLDIFYSRDF